MKTLVALPVFNEAKHVTAVLDEVVRFAVCQFEFKGLPNGARCYPFKELKEGVTEDRGLRLTRTGVSVVVATRDGKRVAHMTGFWFAWCAYYPKGTVYKRTR